jgi:hypothetical protein
LIQDFAETVQTAAQEPRKRGREAARETEVTQEIRGGFEGQVSDPAEHSIEAPRQGAEGRQMPAQESGIPRKTLDETFHPSLGALRSKRETTSP